MDEMKVKLSTKFMRNMVAKLIARLVYKKLGYKIDIQLNDLEVSFVDGDTKLMTNVEIKLDSNEFKNIIKEIGLD